MCTDRWAETGYGRNRKVAFLNTRHTFGFPVRLNVHPPVFTDSTIAMLKAGRLPFLQALVKMEARDPV